MTHGTTHHHSGHAGAAVASIRQGREAALCASITHEINQPLAAIVADAGACRRWLAASPPNHDRVEIVIERILQTALSAAESVDGLRALFMHPDATRAPAQLNEVIREACALAADDLHARQVEIALWLDPALPVLALERTQIRQLLANLIRNGADAMETSAGERRLELRSRVHEGGVWVEVRDRGCGVADPDRMFDAFFSTKAKGMGMGLAICRRIVEAHGGRLWTEPGELEGTRMIFTLPKLDAAPQTAWAA